MISIRLKASDLPKHLFEHGYSVRPEAEFKAICSPDEAHEQGIYFIGPKNKAHLEHIAAIDNVLLFIDKNIITDSSVLDNACFQYILVDNVRRTISLLLTHVEREGCIVPADFAPGIHASAQIHPKAHVDPGAFVGANVTIFPNCYVGPNVQIGPGTTLAPGATVVRNAVIGANCLIRENSVIGGNGFGIEKDESGNNLRIPHLAGVIIGDDVELGALNTVCSGTLKPTLIGDHVKTDDHIHIAHNDIIDENVIITAGTILSGSVHLNSDAWIGINASVKQGITIGKGSTIGMAACVTKDVPPGVTMAGSPAKPLADFLKIQSRLNGLI